MQAKVTNILEIVSAIAVEMSLVFVGLEIRNSAIQTEQNTQALQIAAYQDLIGRIVEMNMIDIEESVRIETILEIENPTDAQRIKLNALLWILFRHGDMAYFQFEQGAISKERMLSGMMPLLSRFKHAQVVERWKEIKYAFVPNYSKFIDQEINKSSQPTTISFREGDRPTYSKTITIEEFTQKQGKVILLDVRLKEDFNKKPTLIPGARYVNPEALAMWSKTLSTDKEIVVYCGAGKWVSQKAAFLLEKQGFNVSNLTGGLAAWEKQH